jgi:Outer membrane protein beta-barrel domain
MQDERSLLSNRPLAKSCPSRRRVSRWISFSLMTILALAFASAANAQYEEKKFSFDIGGGVGWPHGDLSKFIYEGGNFVVGGGFNLNKLLGANTEFMWHDLPVNSATKQQLNTPGATARQYSWTFNPIIHFPLGHKVGGYGIGGIGWYHRSGETTTPGVGVICDPYWSWWYGCGIGTVHFVTGSTSANAFGENIGGGLTYALGGSGFKFYTEFRFHHASYNKVSTDLTPLTFGLRW